VILLGLLPGFIGVEIDKALRARRSRAASPQSSD
jgi:hypothetical protein